MGSVYRIRNTVTAAEYIGSVSTTPLRKRWKEHRKGLNCGKHHNRYLLRAWKKYGSAAFVFEVIETDVPNHLATIREQWWLDQRKSLARRLTYNICLVATSPLGTQATARARRNMSLAHIGKRRTKKSCQKQAATWVKRHGKVYVVLNPGGRRFRFRNIRAFCRKHGLEPNALRVVLIGRVRSCKGWTVPGRPRKIFGLRNPVGRVFYPISNLKRFCREHDLDYRHMHAVCRGTPRYRSHLGWTVYSPGDR